jgi:hypothetical protein
VAGWPLLQSSVGSSQHSAVTAADRAARSDAVHVLCELGVTGVWKCTPPRW